MEMREVSSMSRNANLDTP